MGVAGLPLWLPEWKGAEAEVQRINMPGLRLHAQAFLDLVFSEDYLDTLPEGLESAIVSPAGILAEAIDGGTNVEVIVASRLVRRAVESFLEDAPGDLRRLICQFPIIVDRDGSEG
ncbi:hypothetical protein AB0M79_21240 [Polymorphospora sp. NPDC051019]|uniref:hypothetical protein n=1 Tax=Polymorphospora sp. NPDC051019 TaxID=3155725 RepID=UPI0034349F2C